MNAGSSSSGEILADASDAALPEHRELAASVPAATDIIPSQPSLACRNCGHAFVGEESYCAVCGGARVAEPPPAGETAQPESAAFGNWPSLWDMQEEAQESAPPPEATTAPAHAHARVATQLFASADGPQLPTEVEDMVERLSDDPEKGEPAPSEALAWIPAMQDEDDEPATGEISTWDSAADARRWLDSQTAPRNFWRSHRATVYLAVSLLLLIFVVVRWRMQPADSAAPAVKSVATKAGRQSPPPPELSLFDRLLVNLGLAEAPESPVYLGNPDTRVWVDLHTALYYCPGAQLYGKTEGGKLTTQRDAQQDRYEPATRKACK